MSPNRRTVILALILSALLVAAIAGWGPRGATTATMLTGVPAEGRTDAGLRATPAALPDLESDDLPSPSAPGSAPAALGPAEIAAARELGRAAAQRQREAFYRNQTCLYGAAAMAWFDAPMVQAWPQLEQRILDGDGGAAEVLMSRVSMCEAVRHEAKLAPGPERDRMLAGIGGNLDPATLAMIDEVSVSGVAWFDAHVADCGAANFDLDHLTEVIRRRARATGHGDVARLDAKDALQRLGLFDRLPHSHDECIGTATEGRLMAGDAAPLPAGLRDIARSVVPPDGALGRQLAECALRDCRSLAEVPTTLQPELTELAEGLGLDDDLRERIAIERRDGHEEMVFGWLLYQRWLRLNSCMLSPLPAQIAEVSQQLQASAARLDAAQRERGLALARRQVAQYGSAALRLRGCGP